MSLDADRVLFFSSCKRCWSRLASRVITRMGGERTSGILTPKSIGWARRTRRKSRANTSICGPGSNGWCAAPSVFPRQNIYTIWSLGCSSIAMNLDEPYENGSTPLRHLHLAFANEIGKPVEAGNLLRRSFWPLLDKAGLPHIRFHDLRHTAATLLLQQGVHPKVVSELLGHSSIGMTLDIYSHVIPDLQHQAIAAMDAVLR